MLIETDRMVIRDFTMDDLGDLHEILGDDETMRHCESAYSIEKTADFLQKFCIEKRGALAAALKGTGKVIGYILFNDLTDEGCEIGWFFNRAYWRNGYAFESCKAVIDNAFAHMGVQKIFAETTDGHRSVALMKKLGMKPEGIQPGPTGAALFVYSILAEDWK